MESVRKLPRISTELGGIAPEAVNRFLDAVQDQDLDLHSFMILRNGKVAAEGWWQPYRSAYRHQLFSLSKSFTSTAVGFAVGENRLSLDDRVIDFFPKDVPAEVSTNLAEMRIRHLLMMGTGHAQDTMDRLGKQEYHNWVEAFLAATVDYPPGTHFVYNSGATYMLAAILHKVTGQFLLDYLDGRLLAPLGISGATWETCPRGIAAGGWGLSITTEDIAKFGQLYLQHGVWEGKQLLPIGWVEEATAKRISNGDGGESDWAQGYGYQFWRCRHGAYRGDGAFGQFCIVMPKQEAVVAVTSGTNNLQGVVNLVWEYLLPALSNETIAPNEKEQQALFTRLQELILEAPQAEPYSPLEEQVSGNIYHLEPNEIKVESISFQISEQEADVVIRNSLGDQQLRLGRGFWKDSHARLLGDAVQRVEGSFTWIDQETLELTLRHVETPFTHTIICHFEGKDILLDIKANLVPNLPTIRGRMGT